MRTNPLLSFAASLLFLCQFCAAGTTPELTSIAAAYAVTDDDCRDPRPFSFVGKLLSSNAEYCRIRDDTGGVNLHLHGISTDNLPQFCTVRAHGTMIIDRNGERDFKTVQCTLLNLNAPETPADCTCADIVSGRIDDHLVRVKGVISSVMLDEIDPRSIWITFRDATGSTFLAGNARDFDEKHLQTLVDAEVEVSGLSRSIGGLRHNLGRYVTLNGPADIRVLKPAPENPFLAPPLTTQNVAHRQKANGTVIGVSKDRFFIRTQAGRIIPVLSHDCHAHPTPGSTVSVVGFATLDPYRIQLSEAIVRTETPPTTLSDENFVRTTIENLFNDSSKRDSISISANGTFLVLQGTSARLDNEQLALSSGNYSVFVDLTGCKNGPPPPNGSMVEIRGLCIAEFEDYSRSGTYPKFRRFTILPSSAAAIRILSKPNWWTARKLFYVIIALVVFLVGALVWNRVIAVISERRSKELYNEKIDHALAEQKVEERTRLAVELHDSISQTLTGIALQLDGGEVETAKTMLTSCRGELRRCLWDLRSRTFEEKDMTEAVERTIAPHMHGVSATVRFNVPRKLLSESVTHASLRIVRELVVNAIRHGRASHLKIAGEMHDNVISFSVRDDGCGFDPDAAPGPEKGHFGLLGIRERLEDFNGSLVIDSSVGHGAKCTVTLETSDVANV